MQEVRTPRFEFIDGLRGLAALSVVLFHLNLAIQSHHPHAFPLFLEELFSTGYLGIQVFFVISGFVIAYSLREVQINLSFFSQFFLRRSFRLDPPYWMVIFITLTLAWIASLTFKSEENFPFSLSQIVYNMFYLPDLLQVPLIIPVAWTLCIEFQFYIIFALLLMIIQRTEMKNFYTFFIWSGLALFSILQNTAWAVIPLKPVTFIPHWYSFFLGCLTCWAMLGRIDKRFLGWNYLMIVVCSYWTPTPHAIVSVGTALLIYSIFLWEGLHRVLRERFFQYLGRLSYSLYLIHWPVGMKIVDLAYKLTNDYHPIAVLVVTLFLTILVADIFYRLIERPSHNFSRSVAGSRLQLFFTSSP